MQRSPRLAERRASPLSGRDVLQHRHIQHRLRQQLLQLRVLLLELLQAPDVRNAHAAKLRLPGIERRLRYAVLAAHLAHLQASLLLAQNANDLFFREPASLHPSVPPQGRGLYFRLVEFSGLRSVTMRLAWCVINGMRGRSREATPLSTLD